MARVNTKEEKKIKVKIVYDNFINKYTKIKYILGEIIEISEKRLEEILGVEKTHDVKLIEIIEENGEDIIVETPEVGDDNNEENGKDTEENADDDNDGDDNNDAE